MAAQDPVRTVALVAGEASGDALGAALIHSIRSLAPDTEFIGVGGPAMRQAGMQIIAEAEALAVMGLVEVLAHLSRLLALRRRVFRELIAAAPDVFVGIDAPDFNLGLERRFRRAGVRTVHYVSPSIWAWRPSRAATLGESADRVLCLFPMEPPIYAQHGVDARFVGHPAASSFPLEPDSAAARQVLGFSSEHKIVALLPGSRRAERARHLPDFLDAGLRLARADPRVRLVVAAVDSIAAAEAQALVRATAGEIPVAVINDRTAEVLTAADAALVASGTATLEAALAHTPMVVAYRLHPASYWLVRRLRLLKSRHVSLPNVLAGRAVVPELLQEAMTPAALQEALAAILEPGAATAQRAAFADIHRSLLAPDASAAAHAVLWTDAAVSAAPMARP